MTLWFSENNCIFAAVKMYSTFNMKSSNHTVLFICLGNICRSPAAEGIMNAMVEDKGIADQFFIDSAAIGPWHIGQLPDSRMRRCWIMTIIELSLAWLPVMKIRRRCYVWPIFCVSIVTIRPFLIRIMVMRKTLNWSSHFWKMPLGGL